MSSLVRKASLEAVDREADPGRQLAAIVDELVKEHHLELEKARFGLLWQLKDVLCKGRLVLARIRVVSELYRRLADVDLVIEINKDRWLKLDEQLGRDAGKFRRFLVDHELCHAECILAEGEEKGDALDERPIYRLRGHDVEEFWEPCARWDLLPVDVQRFVERARRPIEGHIGQLRLEDLELKEAA